ncbi:MAG TPA: M15 family metallopeptidase [Blastocatellia bacterium]|nr:M15 family metallopeptidase [Blastocatellia bacterium]
MNTRSLSAIRFSFLITLCLLLIPVAAGRSAAVSVTSSARVASAPDFNAAAAENVRLMHDLNWSFGGKTQRGWYLYVPLVARLIQTGSRPDAPEFAAALARWQSSQGLTPSGVLDHETWMKMVAAFQTQRLRSHIIPAADRLIQAPAADFYAPERPAELRYVEREAYAAYQRLLAAALADPSLGLMRRDGQAERYLKIISAFRSPACQAQLRAQSPGAGRAGLAVNSPHFTGCALDLYVGGEPVSTRDENRALQVSTPVYQWLVRNAERFGFYPYFYEPWHWEYRAR